MEKNYFENIFYAYPRSNNHKIFLTKKNNIKICNLDTNCTKLDYSLSKNKINGNKIFDNNDNKNSKEKFTCISCIYNYSNLLNTSNYDIILFSLIIILLVVLKLRYKK